MMEYRATNPVSMVAMKSFTEEFTWVGGRRRLGRAVHRAHRKAGTLRTALALMGDKWSWRDVEPTLTRNEARLVLDVSDEVRR